MRSATQPGLFLKCKRVEPGGSRTAVLQEQDRGEGALAQRGRTRTGTWWHSRSNPGRAWDANPGCRRVRPTWLRQPTLHAGQVICTVDRRRFQFCSPACVRLHSARASEAPTAETSSIWILRKIQTDRQKDTDTHTHTERETLLWALSCFVDSKCVSAGQSSNSLRVILTQQFHHRERG